LPSKIDVELKIEVYDRIGKMGMVNILCILFLGSWTFVIIGVDVVAFLLVMWLKPEWLKNF
jgi:hypothetical protein